MLRQKNVSLPHNEALLSGPPPKCLCNHRTDLYIDIHGAHSVNATDSDDPLDLILALDMFFLERITSSNKALQKNLPFLPKPQGKF